MYIRLGFNLTLYFARWGFKEVIFHINEFSWISQHLKEYSCAHSWFREIRIDNTSILKENNGRPFNYEYINKVVIPIIRKWYAKMRGSK